jgi:hypothetical protein
MKILESLKANLILLATAIVSGSAAAIDVAPEATVPAAIAACAPVIINILRKLSELVDVLHELRDHLRKK